MLGKGEQTPWLEALLFLALAAHAGLVVYETDARLNHRGPMSPWLRFVSCSLLFIYVADLVARICIYRSRFWHNFWNVLDCVAVATDLASDVFAMALGGSGSILLLRMFRVVRLLRPLRILEAHFKLRAALWRLMPVVKVAAWGVLLLAMVLSVWSIIAVEVLHPFNVDIAASGSYDDCEWCAGAFESVAHGNLTFLRNFVMGDGWDEMLMIAERHPWTLLFFFLVGITVNFGLIILMFVVLPVRVLQSQALAEESPAPCWELSVECERTRSFLLRLCAEMDDDGSGTMTMARFVKGFETNEKLRHFLKIIGIQRDDLQCIFTILDEGDSGSVAHQEFTEQLLRMRARSSDALLMFMRLHAAKSQQKVEEQLIWMMQQGHHMAEEAPQTSADMPVKGSSGKSCDSSVVKDQVRVPTPFATMSSWGSSGSGSPLTTFSSPCLTKTAGSPGSPLNKARKGVPIEPIDSPSAKAIAKQLLFHSEAQEMKQAQQAEKKQALASSLAPVSRDQVLGVSSELDKLRRHLDERLELLVRNVVELSAGMVLQHAVPSADGSCVVQDGKPIKRVPSCSELGLPRPDGTPRTFLQHGKDSGDKTNAVVQSDGKKSDSGRRRQSKEAGHGCTDTLESGTFIDAGRNQGHHLEDKHRQEQEPGSSWLQIADCQCRKAEPGSSGRVRLLSHLVADPP